MFIFLFNWLIKNIKCLRKNWEKIIWNTDNLTKISYFVEENTRMIIISLY